jgi:hypothetical protein
VAGWPGREVRSIAEQEIKRLNINIEVSLHNAFKAATAAKGENMTDVLLACIMEDHFFCASPQTSVPVLPSQTPSRVLGGTWQHFRDC